jgi:hypothetical protein
MSKSFSLLSFKKEVLPSFFTHPPDATTTTLPA